MDNEKCTICGGDLKVVVVEGVGKHLFEELECEFCEYTATSYAK